MDWDDIGLATVTGGLFGYFLTKKKYEPEFLPDALQKHKKTVEERVEKIKANANASSASGRTA